MSNNVKVIKTVKVPLMEIAQEITGLFKEDILQRYCVTDFQVKLKSNRKCRQAECVGCWDKYSVEVQSNE